MSSAEVVQRQLAGLTRSRAEAAVFVRMSDGFAVVNIGTSTLTIPCVGFYPPVAGMAVRVDWTNGSPAVTGPVAPLNPIGTITATGTPLATVSVDGELYDLYLRDGYTPAVDDMVEINWATGIIQGKVTGLANPESPGEAGGTSTPFDVTVRAAGSGRYQPGSGWWSVDPRASTSNVGIWTYANRISDAVGGGTVSRAFVFLPLVSQVGAASIGVHDHPWIPGGAPYIYPSSLMAMPIGRRNGWIELTASVGQYISVAGRGLGVLAPGGAGDTRWRGIPSDAMSGAVRLIGTR